MLELNFQPCEHMRVQMYLQITLYVYMVFKGSSVHTLTGLPAGLHFITAMFRFISHKIILYDVSRLS